MKPENPNITKGKLSAEVKYKKLSALLNDEGKKSVIGLIENGAVCELREKQILSNGAQTMTLKIYFEPIKTENKP